MENPKEYYSNIGRVWCPVLNDYISFNSTGFRHLLRKKGVLRAGADQKRRFNLLTNAVSIIANSEIIVDHKREEALHRIHRDGKGVMVSDMVDFWKLTRRGPDNAITIVVRQFENGNKHFLSIYSKKQKMAR